MTVMHPMDRTFGPFELQACGENDFTTKTLGLLAFRPDLRARLLRNLLGADAPAEDEPISILFFSRIGENFFREAIEREAAGIPGELEARCNEALALPPGFRWARRSDARLVQPAKWQAAHIESMLTQNGRAGDAELRAQLEFVQNCVNTEPDVVLQWGRRLALIEIKVLSGQGERQLARQRRLADLLAALTGLERVHLFLVGPEHGGRPADADCGFVSWGAIARWFADVPEISEYIRGFAFYYRGRWQSAVAAKVQAPGETAWDRMMATSFGATPSPAPHALSSEPPTVSGAPGVPAPQMTADQDSAWDFRYLGKAYFALIVTGCRRNGIWPLRTIWTGATGVPYADNASGRRIDPNWMVEDLAGRRFTRRGGFGTEHRYDPAHMKAWPFARIAARYGFPTR